MMGETSSEDHEAAERYIQEFAKLISNENLTADQIYNADNMSLFWCCVPMEKLETAAEIAPTGIKDAKDRLIMVVVANAAGTHTR